MNNIDSSLGARFSEIDFDVYRRFKTAIELGRWANGDQLNKTQKQLVLQAIIAYENKNLPERERTGYLPLKKAGTYGSTDSTSEHPTTDDNQPDPIRWK